MARTFAMGKPAPKRVPGTMVYYQIIVEESLEFEDFFDLADPDEWLDGFDDEKNGKSWTEDRIVEYIETWSKQHGTMGDALMEYEMVDYTRGTVTFSLKPFDTQATL